MKYNIWNKWDPLEVCVLGNNYAPEFFDKLDDKVADPLKRICEETLEDLAQFKTVLQDFGVEVLQPELDASERWAKDYPRGPLQPRDSSLVIGNQLYHSTWDHPAITECLQQYADINFVQVEKDHRIPLTEEKYDTIKGGDYPAYADYVANLNNKEYFQTHVWQELEEVFNIDYITVSSATAFPLGTRLDIADMQQAMFTKEAYNYYVPETKKFDISFVSAEGHTDGMYHPIKPGAILTVADVQDYAEAFPGWDVCYLPDQSWHRVSNFLKLKEQNQGKWWLAGEEDNAEFTHFVETWLQDWVGYVEETVFDVNVLMLDEHHCCVGNMNNEKVNAFLKKHNVEPVYVPNRHRYFWDGGLHCQTLDVKRRGPQKEYFK